MVYTIKELGRVCCARQEASAAEATPHVYTPADVDRYACRRPLLYANSHDICARICTGATLAKHVTLNIGCRHHSLARRAPATRTRIIHARSNHIDDVDV
jgi:hypothetical protein